MHPFLKPVYISNSLHPNTSIIFTALNANYVQYFNFIDTSKHACAHTHTHLYVYMFQIESHSDCSANKKLYAMLCFQNKKIWKLTYIMT